MKQRLDARNRLVEHAERQSTEAANAMNGIVTSSGKKTCSFRFK